MKSVRMSKPWFYPLVTLVLFACAQGTTKTVGGGGEGGDSWGGQTSSGSKSASSSSGAAGAGGGGGGGTVCDAQSADCTACTTCSRASADGLCIVEYDDCLANFDCVDFATCISNCASGDTICTSDCESFYPTGVSLFDTYASCVICQDCYGNCDGATVCN